MVQQTITIRVDAINEATGKLQTVRKQITEIQKSVRGVSETTKTYQNIDGRMQLQQRKTVQGLQRFQMEWLGIMFAGMAVNRVFGQYIRNATDMLGFNELLSESLSFATFSALEPFHDSLINISTAVLDADEGVQKMIGWGIIAGGLGGTLLSTAGQTALFASSLAQLGGGSITAGLARTFGWLSKIAGIGLITASIVIAYDLITGEQTFNGLDILKAVGSGMALAAGLILVGVSLPASLVLGGLVVAVMIQWKFWTQDGASLGDKLKAATQNQGILAVPGLIAGSVLNRYSGDLYTPAPESMISSPAPSSLTGSVGGMSQMTNVTINNNISATDNQGIINKLKEVSIRMSEDFRRLVGK